MSRGHEHDQKARATGWRSPVVGMVVYWLALLLLTGFHVWDHAAWVHLDRSPMISNDSPMHLEAGARYYWWWKESPGIWFQQSPGVYPPTLYMVATAFFELFGVSSESFRLAQLPFTFLLVLGVGILAGRCYGRVAGIAAAAAATTFPQIWVQRTEGQMDFPLAGAAAMAFALMPTPERPGRPILAFFGGLAMAFSLLTKQAMLSLAGAAMGWMVLRASIDIIRRIKGRRTRIGWGHLKDVAIYVGVGIGFSARWYVTSLATSQCL